MRTNMNDTKYTTNILDKISVETNIYKNSATTNKVTFEEAFEKKLNGYLTQTKKMGYGFSMLLK